MGLGMFEEDWIFNIIAWPVYYPKFLLGWCIIQTLLLLMVYYPKITSQTWRQPRLGGGLKERAIIFRGPAAISFYCDREDEQLAQVGHHRLQVVIIFI